jgi:hypothetical protein
VKLNKKIIYVTHCCAKKDNYIKKTQEKVTPDKLYVATKTHDSLNDVLRMKLDGQFFDINMVFGFQMIKMHGMKKVRIKLPKKNSVHIYLVC